MLAVLLGIALVGLVVLVVFVLQLRGALADLQLELDRTSEELRQLDRDLVEPGAGHDRRGVRAG